MKSSSESKPLPGARITRGEQLSPMSRVFTDQFILGHFLRHFLPRKWNLRHVYERIRSIRYQKGKRDVMKRQNWLSFLGL